MIYAEEKACVKIHSDFWAVTGEDTVRSPGGTACAQVLQMEVYGIPSSPAIKLWVQQLLNRRLWALDPSLSSV